MANEVRLIDAYTLAEEVESLTVTVAGKPAGWNDAKHTVLRTIAEQKSIDPETLRPKGRWMKAHNLKPYCSKCGKYRLFSWSDYISCNYCPNRGAKMEG